MVNHPKSEYYNTRFKEKSEKQNQNTCVRYVSAKGQIVERE